MITKELNEKEQRKFLDRFERISDQVPITKDEAKLILGDYGIDAKESWRQLMARVAAHDEQKRIERRDARFALVREQVCCAAAWFATRRERDASAPLPARVWLPGRSEACTLVEYSRGMTNLRGVLTLLRLVDP